MSLDATFICLTPVRNEAWILEPFLKAVSAWADHIIVLDHQSTDGSRDIARSFEKVTLLTYDDEAFAEAERRTLLVEAARDVRATGQRILVGLDADEAFQSTWLSREQRQRVAQMPPGTTVRFRWANVLPGFERYAPSDFRSFLFVDDGSSFHAEDIHGERLPANERITPVDMPEMHVMHFQYVNWERMKSKQRWYQCWEWKHHPSKRAVLLYRQYHHMDTMHQTAERLPASFYSSYEEMGVDWPSVEGIKGPFWWDRQVLRWLISHEPGFFRKVPIWYVDWREKARALDEEMVSHVPQDPRSVFDRLAHQWLARTQSRHGALDVRIIQKLLQLMGW